MKLRSGRILPTPTITAYVAPQTEKIYDYIVRRNGVINRIRVNLTILSTDNLSYDEKLKLVYSTYCLFSSEFEFLTKYKFEPNKRFIQLFHKITDEWITQYPSLASTLYEIHYKCYLFNR
jgi:hypothetical protein